MRLRLACSGTVAAGTLTVANDVTLVGAGPVFADDDMGTYANYAAGGAGQIGVGFDPPPITPPSTARLRAALLTTYSTANCPELRLTAGGFGNFAEWVPGTSVMVDGWLVTDLALYEGGGMTLLNSGALAINNVNTGAGGKVYEAEVWVAWSTDAPPCRNLKRGDRLDLGGARNYPPSKMQQTSSRGVGAY